jgi:two-component system, LytTR family, response regulator
MINCLVVDDEPIARKGLLEHIRQIDFLHPVAECKSALEASLAIQQERIDLVFMDIQMPKMTGIEFLRASSVLPPVIFTTAYPEYAIEGYELDILDYLLKPISFTRFYKSALKAKEFLELKSSRRSTSTEDFFFIKSNQKIEKVLIRDVLYIEGLSNYIIVHTRQKKYIAYLTFKGIEEELGQSDFLRIHKSYLVSLNAIQSVTPTEVLLENIRLPLSKNYKALVMEKIEKKLFRR